MPVVAEMPSCKVRSRGAKLGALNGRSARRAPLQILEAVLQFLLPAPVRVFGIEFALFFQPQLLGFVSGAFGFEAFLLLEYFHALLLHQLGLFADFCRFCCRDGFLRFQLFDFLLVFFQRQFLFGDGVEFVDALDQGARLTRSQLRIRLKVNNERLGDALVRMERQGRLVRRAVFDRYIALIEYDLVRNRAPGKRYIGPVEIDIAFRRVEYTLQAAIALVDIDVPAD